ncbi:PGAP1-like protein [Geosmithia morbida]|uniref:GPI inositol-deacylase n=1 Tax=Geosmithia morbida TaxID=1094350 RepID=A0A9P5D8A2_9HYPO|nr:PGAP1-like protein [Geosmithia morbida]KAF4125314.1 PGAP1-like protein [Geosmithia morbida]
MKTRSSGSADGGSESSGESDVPKPNKVDRADTPALPTSATRSRSAANGLAWKNGNGHSSSTNGNGHAKKSDTTAMVTPVPPVPPIQRSLSPTTSNTTPTKTSHGATMPSNVCRSLWSMSAFSLMTASLGIIILLAIVNSLFTFRLDPKGYHMSYMRPDYVQYPEFDTEHTRFATKYSLYLYREQGVDDPNRLHGIPVLFIPGNAGSYKQVRPIAAEASNYFHQQLQNDGHSVDSGIRNLDFFTVDFNEDITAFHGQTLLDQAEYLNEAVRFILGLYSDPQQTVRDAQLPDPTSVIVLGHSMGGVVARAMLVRPNYQTNSINTIITMSAPHARPPVTFDRQIVQIYDEINSYWREAYLQKWANNNALWHVTLVSIAGGNLDTIVPSDYASVESLVPETHGFTVFTTGIPTVWTSMDHQAILWCDQFRKVVSRALHEVVDVNRASQTKPRAERMRVLKKRFLSGLEPDSEKAAHVKRGTTLLTIDHASARIVPAGDRLVLSKLGSHQRGKAHLMPLPPQGSPELRRFTLLSSAGLEENGKSGIEVLLCSVFTGSSSPLTSSINLSEGSGSSTKLACENAADDAVVLPASTFSSRYPFLLEGEHGPEPFSYLQYDLDRLSEHQFVVIVDKAPTETRHFMIAEFSGHSEFHQRHDITLQNLLTFGLSTTLPAGRPMVAELEIPSITSSLLAYRLDLKGESVADKTALFAPMVRQYVDRPYESRFFVNTDRIDVRLHGTAPYVPPSLSKRPRKGLTFQFWVDPSIESPLHIQLSVDILGSLGNLYMRYRTILAAFPLLIVTLVLRKQFRVYDRTGMFVSFSRSLDLSLRQSIPLLLLSMTLLSTSVGEAAISRWWPTLNGKGLSPHALNFHRNDLFIGTDDPFFRALVPLIGLVCIGICVGLHYCTLVVTYILAALYGLVGPSLTPGSNMEPRRIRSSLVPSTPRRRMITAVALLLLVSFFIPYQFAYLVACLVQLFTVVRALHATGHASNSSYNYYHYTHSVLLLMLWVLPINLPILAVWIRNLAVHWLTPFSSHHNILSIMPFILLVENLTTGRMIPRLNGGLCHVTSVLLFATALCAGVYGVSHAYILHQLVNVIAAWLVIVHSTTNPWSLNGIGTMFGGNTAEAWKGGKAP